MEPAIPPKPLVRTALFTGPCTFEIDDHCQDIDTPTRDTRTPAKKNRLQLGTTEEEEEAGSQHSSNSSSPPLGVSPPQEMKIKVRQISRGVEDLSWRKNKSESPEGRPRSTQRADSEVFTSQSTENAGEVGKPSQKEEVSETPPKSPVDSQISQSVPDIRLRTNEHEAPHVAVSKHSRKDSEGGDKGLKRKFLERGTSQGPQDTSDLPKSPAEPTKRLRDDPDRDENPRETKRPSPPPEKAQTKSPPPTPKKVRCISTSGRALLIMDNKSGFESYASTSSPFTSVKNIFSSKSSFGSLPSSQNTQLATTPSTPAKSVSPFSVPGQSPPSAPSTAPVKRSAFDMFASSSSPFASAVRAKSPLLGSSSKLGRAKSPPRFSSSANSNAFSSYAQGVQSFAAPTPKRARAESPNGLSNGHGNKAASVLSVLDDTPDSGGSEDSDKAPTFGERLRAEKDEDEEARSDDESSKSLLTEQAGNVFMSLILTRLLIRCLVTTGEEDEETLHQVRGKLYALQGSQWKEKGTGTLKLNVKQSDGTGARLGSSLACLSGAVLIPLYSVMRKEAVFTLLLNVTLFNGMLCSLAQDPRYLRFSAIENGTAVHYNLRVSILVCCRVGPSATFIYRYRMQRLHRSC